MNAQINRTAFLIASGHQGKVVSAEYTKIGMVYTIKCKQSGSDSLFGRKEAIIDKLVLADVDIWAAKEEIVEVYGMERDMIKEWGLWLKREIIRYNKRVGYMYWSGE